MARQGTREGGVEQGPSGILACHSRAVCERSLHSRSQPLLDYFMNRRYFLKTAALAGASAALAPRVRSASANNKIVLAVMGTNGRGLDLIKGFMGQPEVEIAYICDVDDRARAKGMKQASGGAREP